MTTLESKVSEIKQDVITNAAHIDKTEAHISEAEEALEKAENELKSAIKLIHFLEAKTDDLEKEKKEPARIRHMRGCGGN